MSTVYSLPTLREGDTLYLDSWAQLHEDGHQEGLAVDYTRLGLKPCHRPLIAGLAGVKLGANYWLRSGNTACVNGAAEFLRQSVQVLAGLKVSSLFPIAPRMAQCARINLPSSGLTHRASLPGSNCRLTRLSMEINCRKRLTPPDGRDIPLAMKRNRKL